MTSAASGAPSRSGALSLLTQGPPALRIANAIALAGLIGYLVYFTTAGAHAGDAHAYWAADLADPYTTGVNEEDAYLYAPAFLQAIAPLKLLPWEAFWVAWVALNLGALAWTVGPVLAVAVLLPGPYSPVWVNIWYGNIAIFMAAALVLVFRWPATWSFLLLTKITPGVGLAWFAARRQWQHLAIAIGATIVISAVSFILAPGAWFEWPERLTTTSPEIFPLPPLWIRLVAAAAIAAIGGHFRARWTVPLAAVLAQPVFWFTGFAMFIAWIGLLRHRRWLSEARAR